MEMDPGYKIFFVGDTAATIDFGNVIDETINKKVISLFDQLSKQPIPGTIELVPAYSSLTIYYDIGVLRKKISANKMVNEWIKKELNKLMKKETIVTNAESTLVRIPVCYEDEFAPDLQSLSEQKNISGKEIIHLHFSKHYRVYMIGFIPGFAYMGEVDAKIESPRKQQPQSVQAGSVGIAGKQTGIYPLNSPGGWQIIGRTPLKLFDPGKEKPCLLKAGDIVEFYSIGKDGFEDYQSRNS